jgi:hypothetical protein
MKDIPNAQRVAEGIRPNCSLILGVLVACLVGLTNARGGDCLPSADAVRHLNPEAWPSWTLRASGHGGGKCWYAATRATAHQDQMRAAATERGSKKPKTFSGRIRVAEQGPVPRTPSPLLPSLDAPPPPVTADSKIPPRMIGNRPSRVDANASYRPKNEERDQAGPQPPGIGVPRSEGDKFGSAIDKMIGACEEQVDELKRMPFDDVNHAVQPHDNQRDALEDVRRTVRSTADTLASICPKNFPQELGGKLDVLNHVLDAISASLTTIRPAFVRFYSQLDDEQKARLVKNSSYVLPSNDVSAGPKASNSFNSATALQDPTCERGAAMLRSWPIREMEMKMTLSDEQHAALFEVAAASYKAAGELLRACPTERRFTPVGRLEAEQKMLEAFRQGIDDVQPVLTGFEKLLNEDQKKRLEALLVGTLTR